MVAQAVGLDRYRSDYGGTGDVGLGRYWSDYGGMGGVGLDRYRSDYGGTGGVGLDRYRSDAQAPHTPAVALAVRTGCTHATRGAQAGVLVLGQPTGSPDPGPPHTAAQEGRAESQVSPRISQELPLSVSHGTGMTGRGTAGSCHLWGQNMPRLQGLHCGVFESQTACPVLHTWLCSVQNPAHVILCDMPTAWLPGQEACPGGVAAGGGWGGHP
uniref:Uncharacterized protein n=1 Tax=Papio anubis TaxID=9555 RepID=A0A2I3MXJ0_PAPAN